MLEVRELTVAGIPVQGASARLDMLSASQTRVTLAAQSATLADPVGRLSDISLVCATPVVAEPRFGCGTGQLTGRGGPTGSHRHADAAPSCAPIRASPPSAGSGFKVAGTTAKFDGRIDEKGWQVKGSTGSTTVAALRKFATPWFVLPADITGDGKAAIEGGASDAGDRHEWWTPR